VSRAGRFTQWVEGRDRREDDPSWWKIIDKAKDAQRWERVCDKLRREYPEAFEVGVEAAADSGGSGEPEPT